MQCRDLIRMEQLSPLSIMSEEITWTAARLIIFSCNQPVERIEITGQNLEQRGENQVAEQEKVQPESTLVFAGGGGAVGEGEVEVGGGVRRKRGKQTTES